MKTPDIKLNTPVKSSAFPHPSRRGFTARTATLFIAVLGFSMAAGLTDFTAPRAEAEGWVTINRYWKGYNYANGDWQFFYNDGRVKGAGNWTVKGAGNWTVKVAWRGGTPCAADPRTLVLWFRAVPVAQRREGAAQ